MFYSFPRETLKIWHQCDLQQNTSSLPRPCWFCFFCLECPPCPLCLALNYLSFSPHPWLPLGWIGCLHAKLLQSFPTLCDPMDYSLLGSSVCGILQARILEWVAMPSSRESFQHRDRICIFCTGRRVVYHQFHVGREGNGTPLQYSCLENPMDGGTW